MTMGLVKGNIGAIVSVAGLPRWQGRVGSFGYQSYKPWA